MNTPQRSVGATGQRRIVELMYLSAHDYQKAAKQEKKNEASTNTKQSLAVFFMHEMRVHARTCMVYLCADAFLISRDGFFIGLIVERPKSYRVNVSNLHYGFWNNQVQHTVRVSACTQRASTDNGGQQTNNTLTFTRRNTARSLVSRFGTVDGSRSTSVIRRVPGVRGEGRVVVLGCRTGVDKKQSGIITSQKLYHGCLLEYRLPEIVCVVL